MSAIVTTIVSFAMRCLNENRFESGQQFPVAQNWMTSESRKSTAKHESLTGAGVAAERQPDRWIAAKVALDLVGSVDFWHAASVQRTMQMHSECLIIVVPRASRASPLAIVPEPRVNPVVIAECKQDLRGDASS